MRYVEHKCCEGERWDLIALAYYGSGKNIRAIIRANPDYLGSLSFMGGEIIRVPVIDQTDAIQDTPQLPAWKR